MARRKSGIECVVPANSDEWLHVRRGPYLMPKDPAELANARTMADLPFVQDSELKQAIAEHRAIYRIGASEVGIACGVGTVAGLPRELWEKILFRGNEKEENIYFDWGHYAEDFTQMLYSRKTGNTVTAGNHWAFGNGVTDNPLDALRFGATPDGQVWINGHRRGILELKNPYYKLPVAGKFKNSWDKLYASHNDGIPPEYMAQMQYQMVSTGASWCDFMTTLWPDKTIGRDILKLDGDKVGVFMRRVYFSSAYWAWMYPRIVRFSECLRLRTEPTFGHCQPHELPPAVPIVEYPHYLMMHTYDDTKRDPLELFDASNNHYDPRHHDSLRRMFAGHPDDADDVNEMK